MLRFWFMSVCFIKCGSRLGSRKLWKTTDPCWAWSNWDKKNMALCPISTDLSYIFVVFISFLESKVFFVIFDLKIIPDKFRRLFSSAPYFSWFTWFIDLYFWKIIKICTINYFLLFCLKWTCSISTVFDRYRVERGAQSANQKNLVPIRPSQCIGNKSLFFGKISQLLQKTNKKFIKNQIIFLCDKKKSVIRPCFCSSISSGIISTTSSLSVSLLLSNLTSSIPRCSKNSSLESSFSYSLLKSKFSVNLVK